MKSGFRQSCRSKLSCGWVNGTICSRKSRGNCWSSNRNRSGFEPWSVASQLAILMSRAGRHDEALAAFSRIFATWPDSSDDVRFNLGMALIRLGRWEDARAEFARVDFPVAHYGLALTYEKTGQISD